MSCLISSEQNQSGVSRAVRLASGLYMPMNVTFELSQGCNLKCTHCYNFDRKLPSKPKSEKPALNPEEIKRTLGQIREAGGLVVAFSGGEAMLHPHLLDFVREARRLHMAVRLKSNGTLLNMKTAKNLREAGVTEVEVSLYGASPETHDKFTRIPGSFAKTVEGVLAAKEFSMQTTVNFIMHRGCVDELDQMLDLAAELGVNHGMSMEMTARYDGTVDSLDHRITKEDLLKLYTGPRREYFSNALNTTNSVQCSCARTNAGIGYDGTVYPCIGAPIPAGDLREQSFAEIWKTSETFQWIRSLSLKDFKSCEPCEIRPYCQRSSGAIHTNTGDYTGKEDWTCMQASLLKDLNESLGVSLND